MAESAHDLSWLPAFPEFRRLDLVADKAAYNRFYAQFPPYADFSWGNIDIWIDALDDMVACELDGNLVLRFTDVFRDGHVAIELFGRKVTPSVVERLFEYLAVHGAPPRLGELPEETVASLDGRF